MLTLVILGQLFEGKAHGYAIKRTIDRVFGIHKKMSWGSLYPILKKLEKQSMVKKVSVSKQKGGPKQKTFEITNTGRKYFYDLMKSDYDSGDARVLFRYKTLFFDRIDRKLRIKIIKSYQQHCQEGAKSVKKYFNEIKEQKSEKSTYILEVLKHSLDAYRLEKEWTDKLLKL